MGYFCFTAFQVVFSHPGKDKDKVRIIRHITLLRLQGSPLSLAMLAVLPKAHMARVLWIFFFRPLSLLK